jgi:hypothetical protein
MSDGLLDVTIMEPFSVIESAQIAYQLVNKTITQNSKIKTIKCKELTIHRKTPGVIHVDGDPLDDVEDLHVSLIAKDIKMVVNLNKQSWQHPLLKIFTDLYNEVSQPLIETPKKISRINGEILNKLRNKN